MSASTSYVSTPRIRVGDTLDTHLMGDLVALDVEEDIEGMASLEARLLTRGPADQGDTHRYLDRSVLDFGTKLVVAFGSEDGDPLFEGRVSGIGAEFPGDSYSTVRILAEDALAGLRRRRQSRTFEESSTAGIAEQIARDHGLSPDVDLDGPTRRVITQVNLSDLAFLRSLAQSDGAEVWVSGSTLHVQRRADRDQGGATLTYGAALRAFAVTADLAHQCTDVTVAGWSVDDKNVVSEKADSDLLGAELGQDVSGASLLASAFEERHERLVVAEPLDTADARARAAAAYLGRARRFVAGAGTCAGDPGMRVGTTVTLHGVGVLFNGDYRVTRTRHRFDLSGGYETDFDVERAGIGVTS